MNHKMMSLFTDPTRLAYIFLHNIGNMVLPLKIILSTIGIGNVEHYMHGNKGFRSSPKLSQSILFIIHSFFVYLFRKKSAFFNI